MDVPDALLEVIVRASLQRPTPAALRSAYTAAQLLAERDAAPGPWTPDDAHPPLGPSAFPLLRLAVNEQWCRHCGAVVGPWMEHYTARSADGRHTGRISTCCRRPDLVAVTDILQPDEYYICA